jgi:FAD/FMN-containing dehydrogenase
MVEQTIVNVAGDSVDASAIEEFRAGIRGPVFAPSDDGYNEARKIWNAMIDRHPALIVRCAGVADVIDSVKFARKHNILLSIRSGGHNIAGTSLAEGGLVVDLSHQKGIHLDLEKRTARVQSGVTLGDIDRETTPFGYVVPSGVVSETGLAGLTLGGGFGWLTRTYGWTSDNLLSADVVTADGEFVTASESENADLFWGLRGGGGNYGIVISFEFRMAEVGPTVAAGLILYPMDKAPEVIDFYRDFTAASPDELTSLLLLRLAPPAPFLPESVHGQPVVGMAVCYAGDPEKGMEAVKEVKAFGQPIVDTIEPKPFAVHQSFLDAAQASGRNYYWKSDYLPGVGKGAAEVLLQHSAEFPSPESAILVFQLGGAVSRIPDDHSAAAHRDVKFILNAAGSCIDPAKTDGVVGWARGLWSDMRPHSTGGAYVNFLTEEEGADRVVEAYSPAKLEKLVSIKNKYDPTNFFRLNQNIAPTV